MKTAARVTVTAGRRGGASAASRGWRWQRSHCAGEQEDWHRISQHFMETHIFSKPSTFCVKKDLQSDYFPREDGGRDVSVLKLPRRWQTAA